MWSVDNRYVGYNSKNLYMFSRNAEGSTLGGAQLDKS